MANLFTTYESVQPPDIIFDDVKQNYYDIQALTFPDNLKEKDQQFQEDDYEDDDLEPPVITSPISYQASPISYQTPSFIQPQQYDSATQDIIDKAKSFIGTNYKWGGTNPNTGFDCSGLMQYVFKSIGINLPRTAMQQGQVGQKVDIQNAKPGDMIWFGSKNSPSGQHIGLISKIDNGQIYIVDAAGKKLGVTERKLPDLQIKSVRRLLGTDNDPKTVIQFFTEKGLSENQARGILGNLMQESRCDHTATNKKSGAYGIAQWLGDRKQELFNTYGNNPTFKQQLEFIWKELNTTEKKAFDKLLNTKTIADATRVFANNFERAGIDEINMNKRIQFAHNG